MYNYIFVVGFSSSVVIKSKSENETNRCDIFALLTCFDNNCWEQNVDNVGGGGRIVTLKLSFRSLSVGHYQ